MRIATLCLMTLAAASMTAAARKPDAHSATLFVAVATAGVAVIMVVASM